MSDDQAYDPTQLGYDEQEADPTPYGPPAPHDFATAGGMTGNAGGVGYTTMGNDGAQFAGQYDDPAPYGPPAPPPTGHGAHTDPTPLGPSIPAVFDPTHHIEPTQIALPTDGGVAAGGMTGNAHGGAYLTMGYDGTPVGGITEGPHQNPTPITGFDTPHHQPECRPLRGFDPVAAQADIDRGPQMFQGHPDNGPTYDQTVDEWLGQLDAVTHGGVIAPWAHVVFDLDAAQTRGVGNFTDLMGAPATFGRAAEANRQAGRPVDGQARYYHEPPRQ